MYGNIFSIAKYLFDFLKVLSIMIKKREQVCHPDGFMGWGNCVG